MSSSPNTSAPMVTVSLPADLVVRLQAAAERTGLTLASYLETLEAIAAGQIPREMLGAIREIYTHDREILRELAK